MSSTEERTRTDNISVGGSTEFEDDDAALEALVQLKELSFGEVFNDRDTVIESEESDGVSILFYHTENRNQLRLYTVEEGHVHINCNLSGESALETHDILTKIADEVGEVLVGDVNAMRFIDVSFETFDFPIVEETEHDITGIRITDSDANYIVQTSDDPGVSFVSRGRRLDGGEPLSEIPSIGTSDWEAIDEFVDEFV